MSSTTLHTTFATAMLSVFRRCGRRPRPLPDQAIGIPFRSLHDSQPINASLALLSSCALLRAVQLHPPRLYCAVGVSQQFTGRDGRSHVKPTTRDAVGSGFRARTIEWKYSAIITPP